VSGCILGYSTVGICILSLGVWLLYKIFGSVLCVKDRAVLIFIHGAPSCLRYCSRADVLESIDDPITRFASLVVSMLVGAYRMVLQRRFRLGISQHLGVASSFGCGKLKK
jgi:hypothetical protein